MVKCYSRSMKSLIGPSDLRNKTWRNRGLPTTKSVNLERTLREPTSRIESPRVISLQSSATCRRNGRNVLEECETILENVAAADVWRIGSTPL